jgi:PAS domain S-box-containing protein
MTDRPAERPDPWLADATWSETDRYRRLVEDSLGLICAHDLDGKLLFVNDAAARLPGYTPEDGIGRDTALETRIAGQTHELRAVNDRVRTEIAEQTRERSESDVSVQEDERNSPVARRKPSWETAGPPPCTPTISPRI